MRRRGPIPAVILALLVSGLPSGAQDCHDYSGYIDCPPTPIHAGPQDCAGCTPLVDDDNDGALQEEILNYADDDGDTLIDEDISCLNSCDPMAYRGCPPDRIPAEDLIQFHPAEPAVNLPVGIFRWERLAGEVESLATGLVAVLEPLDLQGREACGSYGAMLSVRPTSDPGTVYFQGPVSIHFSRFWETLERSLVPGAEREIQVLRYLLRAELHEVTPIPARPGLFPPCAAAFGDVFFYGHLDLARDTAAPNDTARWRYALGLTHPRGHYAHPPQPDCDPDLSQSARPLQACRVGPTPEAHCEEGWSLVGPAAGFRFDPALAPPEGFFTEDSVRPTSIAGDMTCETVRNFYEGNIRAVAPDPSGGNEYHRDIRFCVENVDWTCEPLNIESESFCRLTSEDLAVYFSLGEWDRDEFPGRQRLHAFEGAITCLDNFAPYFYGVGTQQLSTDLWAGPERALDVVDNWYTNPMGGRKPLVGGVWNPMPGVYDAIQTRVLTFFAHVNPDIPSRAPCVTEALVDPAELVFCGGSDFRLDGSPSTIENCCQCGAMEFRWSEGAVVLADWSGQVRLDHQADADTVITLETRCNHSHTCTGRFDVPVRVITDPELDAGPDAEVCRGERVVLDVAVACLPGCPSEDDYRYRWIDETTGLPACDWGPDSSCEVGPDETTGYTAEVTCSTLPGAPARDTVTVTVLPLPEADAGQDVSACGALDGVSPTDVPLSGGGTAQGGATITVYAWTILSGPGVLVDGDTANPTLGGVPADTQPQVTRLGLVVTDSNGCVSTADETVVTVDPDPLPGAVGYTLRASKINDDDILFSWVDRQPPVGGYELVVHPIDQGAPTPAAMDAAEVVHGRLVPQGLQSMVHQGGQGLPPYLSFYKVRAVSYCSQAPGPTKNP